MMKHTTISVPSSLHLELQMFAQQENMSASRLAQQILTKELEDRRKTQVDNIYAAWKKAKGIGGTDGPADLAQNHDYYLYGEGRDGVGEEDEDTEKPNP